MQKKLSLWHFIATALQQQQVIMLLYVLESKGSSPGRQGFCMAVDYFGNMHGSIGGGMMEHKLVELAKEQLKEYSGNENATIKKQVHDKTAATNQSGMICSGEQTVVLLKLTNQQLLTIAQLIESLEQHKNGLLELSPHGLHFSNESPSTDFKFHFQSENDWKYLEKTGFKNNLFIVGGGHCALALSELMSKMDFYITVFDNRENLHTMVNNHYCHQKQWITHYSEISHYIPSAYNNYVVIMTFGYRTDDIAIRALFTKSFKYMGILGSKSKMDKLFANYLEEGISASLLQHIHTPAGISIKSQTPEEIAISIAAQIIQTKNAC